jgi:hypothetical protein
MRKIEICAQTNTIIVRTLCVFLPPGKRARKAARTVGAEDIARLREGGGKGDGANSRGKVECLVRRVVM